MDVEESPWADSSHSPKPTSQSNNPADSRPSTSTSTTQATSPASRLARGPRRLVAQPTRLEAVEDPLGPLSVSTDDHDGASDAPPVPPLKEQMVIRTTMPHQQQPRRPTDPHHVDDDDFKSPGGPRVPPPVDAARPSSMRTSTQPSVTVEQAAKPSFHITVGDPVKIGDLTSSHIVYSVRTRVGLPENLCPRYGCLIDQRC
ncbi:hypothetical protein E4U54_002127 [Claviceps lovelessii]|nr:hypothetical protein E4U54_002127 [Claviceps lovelessii]